MDAFGTYRSIDPRGALPQQARVLDATSPLREDEVLIDVEYLNVDSASWRQLESSTGGSSEALAARIRAIVGEAGKMHNPVTGSGGMLVGRVAALGAHRVEPPVGTRIATLVSLTATPLVLDEVDVRAGSEKVRVRGQAILFGSGLYTELPEDLDDAVALGVLDVCGAPAWAARLVQPGTNVVVVGAGGKSGMLTCAQAARSAGPDGRVVGLCWPEETAAAAKDAGAEAVVVDCTDSVAVLESVTEAFAGGLADVVFVCTNVPGCEGGAILACDDEGEIVFFSMATSFTAAALTAEALGKSCRMTIGNGYVPGHARLALDLVRSEPRLRERFEG
jgi:L-erythro-3,5-diaminohexanoate dehydrogenase